MRHLRGALLALVVAELDQALGGVGRGRLRLVGAEGRTDLRLQPGLRIALGDQQLAGLGAEAEAGHRDGGCEITIERHWGTPCAGRRICCLYVRSARFRRGTIVRSGGFTKACHCLAIPPSACGASTQTAETAPAEGGFAVRLDGRQPRSPQGQALILPTEALARLVADEWAAQGENILP